MVQREKKAFKEKGRQLFGGGGDLTETSREPSPVEKWVA